MLNLKFLHLWNFHRSPLNTYLDARLNPWMAQITVYCAHYICLLEGDAAESKCVFLDAGAPALRRNCFHVDFYAWMLCIKNQSYCEEWHFFTKVLTQICSLTNYLDIFFHGKSFIGCMNDNKWSFDNVVYYGVWGGGRKEDISDYLVYFILAF